MWQVCWYNKFRSCKDTIVFTLWEFESESEALDKVKEMESWGEDRPTVIKIFQKEPINGYEYVI